MHGAFRVYIPQPDRSLTWLVYAIPQPRPNEYLTKHVVRNRSKKHRRHYLDHSDVAMDNLPRLAHASKEDRVTADSVTTLQERRWFTQGDPCTTSKYDGGPSRSQKFYFGRKIVVQVGAG